MTGKYTKLIITDTALNHDIEYIKKIDTGEFYFVSGDYNDTQWIVGFEKDDGPGSITFMIGFKNPMSISSTISLS